MNRSMVRPAVSAIVPAYNEEATVGDVVRALVSSGVFRDIIVVDDGSSDGTAREAGEAGARVIRLKVNLGKGAAMAAGVDATDSDIVCFFDADLIGLAPERVRDIVSPVSEGVIGMNVGIVDRGPLANALARRLPLVSGQRALPKVIFQAIPRGHLTGYGVEVALNYACRVNGIGVGTVSLSGVSVLRKTQKTGLLLGLCQYARMWFWVGIWMMRVRLDRSGFESDRALNAF